MAPPELPADAPVLDVVHPFVVSLRPVFGHETNRATLDSFDSRFRKRLNFHVPLIGQIRFDDSV